MRGRSTPWIHLWSRRIIAVIAIVGVIENIYLTAIKLMGGTAVCPTSGCDEALNSPYATVLGLPLTLFGLLAYTTVLILALAPLSINPVTEKSRHQKLETQTGFGLFLVTTAMVCFSSYLMYLLFFKLQAVCPYCIASALFCVSLFVLTLIGQTWEDVGQLWLSGLGVAMITGIVALGLYNSVNVANLPASGDDSQGQVGLAITTTSGPAEIALARHLTEIGVKEYGAYWCSHCYDQKQLFGKEAFAIINYVECDANGKNPQTQLCQEVGIKGFPTWEIKGEFYPGIQPLRKLAELSNYQGQQNFKF
ncbi:vitamin K epoxide reductase family protein [Planktothrix mougeotii]|uniref:Vitamin K epoxide reductase family protein n=1 Tax=Planktothrix mougeotii LEGE 06226 TaxID=1828728 RepID=A0ABR9UI68_9CYAN|nr:vitamin K epoxide reductase family protein [Planktothrix mougeotii]MBE9145289.1 vitamin K epoxide reductase family protein [Planktothrix mougeotii LEGE 06226]